MNMSGNARLPILIAVLALSYGVGTTSVNGQRFPTPEEKDLVTKRVIKQMEVDYITELTAERIAKNRATIELLNLIIDNKVFAEALAVSEEQHKVLSTLRDEYVELQSTAINEASDEQDRANRLFAVEKQLLRRINEVLVPFQQQQLLDTNYRNAGIPKLLTESPVGNALELTDAQRDHIRSEAEKLAEDIYTFVHESRRRARDLVINELTVEQKKRLTEIVGEKELQAYFEQHRIEKLFDSLNYGGMSKTDGQTDIQVFRTELESISKEK